MFFSTDSKMLVILTMLGINTEGDAHPKLPLELFCSMGGHRMVPSADEHFYCATKYAVTALTEGIRQELREANTHIRATVRQRPLLPHPLPAAGDPRSLLSGPEVDWDCDAKQFASPTVYISWNSGD